MATGDTSDIVTRMRAVLPTAWFPTPNPDGTTNTPILDGILTGLAWPWTQIYTLGQFVQLQTRIATATGAFLDIICTDFFGSRIARRPGQGDASLRTRILAEVLRARATRASLIKALIDLTGRVPIVFEPRWPPDTGGYGFLAMTVGTNLAYGSADHTIKGAGGYGSLQLPFQFFVTAFRPTVGGISKVAGYYTGSGWAGGGYGIGAIQWASLSMSQGQITDADIYAMITGILPVSSIAWVRIES